MKRTRNSFLVLCCAVVLNACARPEFADGGEWALDVVDEVSASVASFEQAEGDLDVDGVLAHIAPDFYMYQDGRRVGYAAVDEQIRATMPTLRAFVPRFDDVEVTPLAPDAALVSLVFHDVITDAEGNTTRMWGPTSFVWRKRDGRWWLVYADSDHYPEPVTAGEERP